MSKGETPTSPDEEVQKKTIETLDDSGRRFQEQIQNLEQSDQSQNINNAMQDYLRTQSPDALKMAQKMAGELNRTLSLGELMIGISEGKLRNNPDLTDEYLAGERSLGDIGAEALSDVMDWAEKQDKYRELVPAMRDAIAASGRTVSGPAGREKQDKKDVSPSIPDYRIPELEFRLDVAKRRKAATTELMRRLHNTRKDEAAVAFQSLAPIRARLDAAKIILETNLNIGGYMFRFDDSGNLIIRRTKNSYANRD